MHLLIQAIILGVLTGGLYALMTSGLTLTFGTMRIINMAQGVFVVCGAYVAFTLFNYLHIDPFLSILISTPLLFHLLKNTGAIHDLHIMLQREVVARMAAQPNDEDYGRLTIMLAPLVTIEWLFDVGPGAFKPPPRVWSAVARLTVRPEPAFTVSPHFAKVVAAAFSHRRKTLRNSLRGLVSLEQIESCGLNPGARPETFAPQAFNDLAKTLDSDTSTLGSDTPLPNA